MLVINDHCDDYFYLNYKSLINKICHVYINKYNISGVYNSRINIIIFFLILFLHLPIRLSFYAFIGINYLNIIILDFERSEYQMQVPPIDFKMSRFVLFYFI